jgi:NADH dehydrogenase
MSFNIVKNDKKRVIIVGGGFGGLKLANKLKKSGFQVVLVDKNNYHQFPPLIYQVASAGLEPSSISFPFRKIFQKLPYGRSTGHLPREKDDSDFHR